jgi:hypothetical protein
MSESDAMASNPVCREIPNPNFQIPGKSQLVNSKKSKSDV